MPKKGGKKHNRNKNKGGGGGGGNKAPDVKNVISPGHKEEEQLLSGEGATKAEETTSAAAGGSGTEPTVPTVETTGPADKTTSQPSAASPEEKILDLPTRQKDVDATGSITQDTRAGEPSAAGPVISETIRTEETSKDISDIAAVGAGGLTTSPAADQAIPAVSAAQASDKPETSVAISTAAGTDKIPKDAPKEYLGSGIPPTSLPAGFAGTAAGTAALLDEKADEIHRTIPSAVGFEKLNLPRDTPVKTPAEEPSSDTGDHLTSAPLVAPHVKRAHEVPSFVTEDRDQPPKKPRVDEASEAQPKSAIPGSFPTPSVAGSVASGTTDNAIVSETSNLSRGGTVSDKSDSVAAVATKGPTEKEITAPAAQPATINAISANNETISRAGGVAGAGSTTDADAESENRGGAGTIVDSSREVASAKEPVLPSTTQRLDTSENFADRPAKPQQQAAESIQKPTDTIQKPEAAAQKPPTLEQQQQQPSSAEAEASKPVEEAGRPKEAKKGGFMAWIKRKIKGEKTPAAATSNGNGPSR